MTGIGEYVVELGAESGVGTFVTTVGERIIRCRDCAYYWDASEPEDEKDEPCCLLDPDHTGRLRYTDPDDFCSRASEIEEDE